jgi:hypothetical protein
MLTFLVTFAPAQNTIDGWSIELALFDHVLAGKKGPR